MEKRQFHLGVVISVATGRFVATGGFNEYHTFLEFLAGERLFSHQLLRVHNECAPHMVGWFPWMDSPEMRFALGELTEMLKTQIGKEETEKLLLGWLSKVACGKYGKHNLPLVGDSRDMLEVEPLPPEAHERIDFKSEALEHFHPDNIINI